MPLLVSIDTTRSANDKRLHSHRCVDAYYLGAEHARHFLLRGRFLPDRVVRSFTEGEMQNMLENKELERWTAGEVAAMNDHMKSLAPGAVAVGFSNLTPFLWNAAWAHYEMRFDDGDSRALLSDDVTDDECYSVSLKEVARKRGNSELSSSTLSPSPKQWTPKKCIALQCTSSEHAHFTPPIQVQSQAFSDSDPGVSESQHSSD
jgi:hypothetical protein